MTGGSKGLGAALVRHLLGKGHQVTSIDRQKRDEGAEEYLYHDFKFAFTRCLSFDVLILNHATFDGFVPFKEISDEAVTEYLQVNLLSHLQLIRVISHKQLVFVNSVLSIVAFPGASLYSASKSFMHSFLETIRREGTNVLVVYPYKINTMLFSEVRSIYMLDTDQVARSITEKIEKKEKELYLPWVFAYAWLVRMLPLRVLDMLVWLVYAVMIKKRSD